MAFPLTEKKAVTRAPNRMSRVDDPAMSLFDGRDRPDTHRFYSAAAGGGCLD